MVEIDLIDFMEGPVHAIHTTFNLSVKSSLATFGSEKQPKVYVTFVNRQEMIMELETCSENSVFQRKVWVKLGLPRLYSWPTLTAYGGYSLPGFGAITAFVTFKRLQAAARASRPQ